MKKLRPTEVNDSNLLTEPGLEFKVPDLYLVLSTKPHFPILQQQNLGRRKGRARRFKSIWVHTKNLPEMVKTKLRKVKDGGKEGSTACEKKVAVKKTFENLNYPLI